MPLQYQAITSTKMCSIQVSVLILQPAWIRRRTELKAFATWILDSQLVSTTGMHKEQEVQAPKTLYRTCLVTTLRCTVRILACLWTTTITTSCNPLWATPRCCRCSRQGTTSLLRRWMENERKGLIWQRRWGRVIRGVTTKLLKKLQTQRKHFQGLHMMIMNELT